MTEVSETAMNHDHETIALREQIRNYIEAKNPLGEFRNKVKANNTGTVCGDGRMEPEFGDLIHMLGGDEGLAMAILGACNVHEPPIKISPEELIARLSASLRDIRGEDKPFGMHSDEHAEHDGGIGCGHVARAAKGEAKHKNITAKNVEDLHNQVIAGEHEKIVLPGKHEEQAVLLVYGRDWTVRSRDDELGQMYFVVDMDRAMDLIEQVVQGLGIEGLTVEAVKEQFECQMNETIKVLAGGKDIFNIHFHPSGDFEINHAGVVPMSVH
jgi:hypothetical protein